MLFILTLFYHYIIYLPFSLMLLYKKKNIIILDTYVIIFSFLQQIMKNNCEIFFIDGILEIENFFVQVKHYPIFHLPIYPVINNAAKNGSKKHLVQVTLHFEP